MIINATSMRFRRGIDGVKLLYSFGNDTQAVPLVSLTPNSPANTEQTGFAGVARSLTETAPMTSPQSKPVGDLAPPYTVN